MFVREVIYLEGLDNETTNAMVEAYAEEWGGELAEPAELADGTARLVFADARSLGRFLSSPHYVNDVPVRAIVVTEPAQCSLSARTPRELDLDGLFWAFCATLLQSPSVDELQESPVYGAMYEAIQKHRSLNDRQRTPISLSYTSVWGPVSMAELTLRYPEGVSYAPTEDRLYFNDIDALFYGLQKWYRDALQVLPGHEWLRDRARDFDRVLQKIHTTMDADDLTGMLGATRLA